MVIATGAGLLILLARRETDQAQTTAARAQQDAESLRAELAETETELAATLNELDVRDVELDEARKALAELEAGSPADSEERSAGAAPSLSSIVETFVRAPVGCTSTIQFTETGTFYVYEETGDTDESFGSCTPIADPLTDFDFTLRGPSGTAARAQQDTTISYDTETRRGTSVASIEINETGDYYIEVVGDDPNVLAAIGRNSYGEIGG